MIILRLKGENPFDNQKIYLLGVLTTTIKSYSATTIVLKTLAQPTQSKMLPIYRVYARKSKSFTERGQIGQRHAQPLLIVFYRSAY